MSRLSPNANQVAPGSGSIEVGQVLDQIPLPGLPLLVAVFTTLTMVFDGFDIQAIAFAAPSLLTEWGIDRKALAPALAAGLLGMALGALTLGAVGDYLGRKRALIGSLLLVIAGSWLTTHASGLMELATYRLITGLGLGGSLPNAAALIAEFAPPRVRNVVLSITVVGVPVGGMLGAVLASELIPVFGWSSIFVVGALLPAALVLAMLVWLPESPRFLVAMPHRWPQLARLLNRLTGSTTYRDAGPFHIQEPVASRVGVAALFVREFRYDTTIVWLIFFTNVFVVYALFSWLPVVLTTAGLSMSTAFRGMLVFNLGGVVSSIVAGGLMTRLGSRKVLTALAVLGVVSLFAIAQLSTTESGAPLLLSVLALAGAGILALQVAMYAVAAHIYPTPCRSSGLGWALGIARIGGILSSFGGGFLLATGAGTFFAGVAGVLVLTLLGIVVLRRHMPGSAA